MASYNKVTLMGNLTRDPEMRVTPGGTTVTKFGMAVNRKWKDSNGEAREKATFVDIDCFAKPAEIVNEYCKKGDLLLIDGRLELDQWETDAGEKRQKLKVVLENFTLMPRSVQGNAEQAGGRSAAPSRPVGRSAAPSRPVGRQGQPEPEQSSLPDMEAGCDVPF